MIITCTLNYDGHNYPVEQLKHDIGEFAQEHGYEIHAYYEWQQGILCCEMPREMAFQFVLKYPEHQTKILTEQKFTEQYKNKTLQFELEDPTQ